MGYHLLGEASAPPAPETDELVDDLMEWAQTVRTDYMQQRKWFYTGRIDQAVARYDIGRRGHNRRGQGNLC